MSGYIRANDLENSAKNMIRTRDELYGIIRDCTGQSLGRIAEDCSRDCMLSAGEALEYGIVDEIVAPAG